MVEFKTKWLFNFLWVVCNILAAIFAVSALYSFVMIIAVKFGYEGGSHLTMNERLFSLIKLVVLCYLMYNRANSSRLRGMN